MSRPPSPPFDDAWNSRDSARVALGYTQRSQWRNREVVGLVGTAFRPR
jgi:hypothetical protein